MNFHPILVHFPIALLTVYALLEVASLIKPIRDRAYVFYVKAVFLLGGTLAAIPAYLTGYLQKQTMQPGTTFYRVMIIHSHWALATIVIFACLAVVYAAAWLCREWTRMPEGLKKILLWHRYATETVLVAAVALIGLAAVTVTGALGGSLAYGPDVDPIVSFIYKLLVK